MAKALRITLPESSRHPSCDVIIGVAVLSALLLFAAWRRLAGIARRPTFSH